MLLVVHLLLGFRRLREADYYRDDPLVLRILGLRKLPDVSTISRTLSSMDSRGFDNVRILSKQLVIEGLQRERFPRLTLDFDGSVQSTKGHAEGSAVGFNKAKKGARSYYPLFCTVAQTAQFFDVHHRPGNVHDSNGAAQFMFDCFSTAKSQFAGAILESRMDSAFFNEGIISMLNNNRVKFTASVPFERFSQLKKIIEDRKRWHKIDGQWSYFETNWKPNSWDDSFRFVFTRKKNKKQQKGPLQLKLFEPVDFDYDYKVIVTNKIESAKNVVLFHNGRGSQEAIFGDAKTDTALDVIPCRRLAANQVFTVSAMLAHNLSREIQMLAKPAAPRAQAKRPAAWKFEKLDTIRHRIIQRAGRLNRPQGKLTLTMSANQKVKKDLLHFLNVLQKATSSHLKGLAVDIKAQNPAERWAILYGLLKADFRRIGIGSTYIHVDDDQEKYQEVCWVYCSGNRGRSRARYQLLRSMLLDAQIDALEVGKDYVTGATTGSTSKSVIVTF